MLLFRCVCGVVQGDYEKARVKSDTGRKRRRPCSGAGDGWITGSIENDLATLYTSTSQISRALGPRSVTLRSGRDRHYKHEGSWTFESTPARHGTTVLLQCEGREASVDELEPGLSSERSSLDASPLPPPAAAVYKHRHSRPPSLPHTEARLDDRKDPSCPKALQQELHDLLPAAHYKHVRCTPFLLPSSRPASFPPSARSKPAACQDSGLLIRFEEPISSCPVHAPNLP